MSEESGSAEAAGIAVTAMFVEVLVTGIGLLTAVTVCFLGFFRVSTAEAFGKLSTPVTAAVFLSLSYVLGIVVDRAADSMLGKLSRRIRKEYFPGSSEYLVARIGVSKVPSLAAQITYARSRMRVCRGWMVIFPLLTAALDFWIIRVHRSGGWVSSVALCSVVGLILVVGVSFAWWKLVSNGYREMAKEWKLLQSRD